MTLLGLSMLGDSRNDITTICAPPMYTTIKIIPAAHFAVFSAWARSLDDMWSYVLESWLPDSPYQEPGYIIQRYDRLRYLQAPPQRKEIDIMIPLRRKEGL